MANEITTTYSPNSNLYFVVFDPAGLIWDGSIFVILNISNWNSYTISLIENGTGSGVYVGTFPVDITTAGVYNIVAYEQKDVSPNISDSPPVSMGTISWDGDSESDGSALDISVQLSQILKVVQAIRKN
jgi:hypothetical protein